MNRFTSSILILQSLLAVALGRFIWGQCPNIEVQEPFDIKRFAGVWHEAARDKWIPFEKHDCVTGSYRLNADGSLAIANS